MSKRQKDLGALGLGGIALRQLDRAKRREQVCAAVEKVLDDFLTRNPVEVFTEESLKNIEATIPVAESTLEKQQQNRHLMVLLKKKAEQGLVVEAWPAQIVTVHQSPSPFQPSHFTAMPVIAALARRHQDLLDSVPELNSAQRAGQILFSAMLGGALLSSKLLRALPGLIHEPLHHHERMLWVDFHLDQTSEEKPGSTRKIRRWLCDPISTGLILNWRRHSRLWPEGDSASVPELLRGYLHRLGCTVIAVESKKVRTMAVQFEPRDGQNWRSMSFTVSKQPLEEFLLDGAEVWWRLRIPSTLVDYGRNLDLAPSLVPDAWRRLLLGGQLPPGEAPPAEEGEEVPDQLEYQYPERGLLSEASRKVESLRPGFDGMGAIRSCLRGNKRLTSATAAKRLMAVEESQLMPIEYLLLHWALWLVRDGGTVVVSSALRYLDSIGARLVRFGRDLTFEELRSPRSKEVLVSIYDAVMADIKTPGNREYVQARIIEFHRFLIDFADIPPMTWRGQGVMFGYPVRANLLTELDYQTIRAAIGRLDLPARSRSRLGLLHTILFRCGLRRAELEGRLATDVQGVPWDAHSVASRRPILSIHAVEQSSLKSLAAGRRLPLAHLLTREELGELRSWCQLRRREIDASELSRALLFGDVGNVADRNDVSYWLDVLQAIARTVTGQGDLVIHHYRHSFLSLLAAKVLAVEAGKLARKLDDDEADVSMMIPQSLGGAEDLSPGPLVRRLHQSEQLQRESLYLVARMGGHRDPLHTTQSYLHLMDWSLGSMTAALAPEISSKGLAAWCDMTVGAFNAAVSRDTSGRDRLQICLDRVFSGAPLQSVLVPLQATAPYPDSLDADAFISSRRSAPAKLEDFSLGQIYHLLQRCSVQEDYSTVAEIFSLDPSTVIEAVCRAKDHAGRPSRFRSTSSRRRGLLRSSLRRGEARHKRAYKFHELPSLAPALPVSKPELLECARVYRRLVNALAEERLQLKSVTAVLDMLNRSNTRLWVSWMPEISDLSEVLRIAGISLDRVHVDINSIEPGKTAQEATRRVRQLLAVPNANIDTEGSRRAPVGKIVGSLSISVRSEARPCENASGWKIGLFYSLIAASGLRLLF